MSRLPPFFTSLSPVGEVLRSVETELANLQEDIRLRNGQFTVSGADDSLSFWENDYSLSHSGQMADRRGRVLAALLGGQTLTVQALEEMARALGGADLGIVTERFDRHKVILSALYDGREAEDLSALRQAVQRRKPAHLEVEVRSSLPEKRLTRLNTTLHLASASRKYAYGAATTPGHLLFAGGISSANASVQTSTDAFDMQLSCIALEPLSIARRDLSGAQVGGYALFAGGFSGNTHYSTVDGYDTHLTRVSVTSMRAGHSVLAAAALPGYALFAGGYSTYNSNTAQADAYDANLTRTALPDLYAAVMGPAGAAVGSYAIFAGGDGRGSNISAAVAYDAALTKTTAPAMRTARNQLAAAATDSHALFTGGQSGSGMSTSQTDAYDAELTRSTAENLSVDRQGVSGTTLEGAAIFAGGYSFSLAASTDAADCYLPELTRVSAPSLSEVNSQTAAGTVGYHALFGLSGDAVCAYTFD